MDKLGRESIKKKYFSVILALIASILLGDFLAQYYLLKQNRNSEIVDVAGFQRMLSQRLAKNSVLLQKDPGNKELIQKIQSDYESLKRDNTIFTNKKNKESQLFSEKTSASLKELSKDINSINQDIECVVKGCSSSNESVNNILGFGDSFVINMDGVLKTSVKESKDQIRKFILIKILLLLVVVILIGFEFYKIVLPVNKVLLWKIDELSKSQGFSKKIEEVAHIGWWELDVKTGDTVWSDEVYKIHKIPIGSPTNKVKGIEFYAPHERPRITKFVEDCISKKKRYDDEFEFYDSEGSKKWVRAIGEPILDSDGNVVKLLGIFQDLTQTKSIEKENRDSKKYLELAIEGANLGIWDWYLTDNRVNFDRKWAEMLGIRFEDIGSDLSVWESRVHPDDIDKCYSDLQSYMKGETDHYENIHRMKHADGRWVYILDRGKFSDWDDEGRPTRFTGTHLDITESQKLQDEQKFILSSAKVGIWKWDIVNNVLEWDDSLYDLYDVNKNEFDGAYDAWEKTLHPKDKDRAKKDLEEALLGNKDFDTTFAILTKNKEIKYIGGRATIHREESGAPVYMYGINWDKTDEHLAQQELVEQRKIAFHNSKLASIGSLAAGVGHEINNPLAIIRGYMSIIRKMAFEGRGLSKEDIEGFANKINMSVDRIANIVSGLRAFSRSDFDSKTRFNITEAIEEYISMIKEIYSKEGIDITQSGIGFDEDIYINGNRGKIQQVLMNFLSNAKDATLGQKKRIINIIATVENGNFKLQVSDNGPGVPEEVVDRVFDPFFTTKDVGQGTGIGLSISQGIIDEHGGEIKLLSDSEMTTFQISLPTVKAPRPKIIKESEGDHISLEGYSVLLAEDEADIRAYLEKKLKELGLKVQTFANGEGLYSEYIKAPEEYDIIISDMKMPVMDGVTLLRKIRGQNLKQPKFIVVTGGIETNFEDKKSEISQLVDGYFLKPFTDEAIKKAVLSVIKED